MCQGAPRVTSSMVVTETPKLRTHSAVFWSSSSRSSAGNLRQGRKPETEQKLSGDKAATSGWCSSVSREDREWRLLYRRGAAAHGEGGVIECAGAALRFAEERTSRCVFLCELGEGDRESGCTLRGVAFGQLEGNFAARAAQDLRIRHVPRDERVQLQLSTKVEVETVMRHGKKACADMCANRVHGS